MFIYAGIDEAGYGPMFGPLLVARSVFAIPKLASGSRPPQLWQRLSKAVCRDLSGRKGRIAVADSKKVYTPASGLEHLERGVLAFAALAGHQPGDVGALLDCLQETAHRQLDHLPWYAPCAERPWQVLPGACTSGEIAIARSMLRSTCERIGVQVPDMGAAVVFEDRFNTLVAQTRSKAAASFTFVARHLDAIWQRYGEHGPTVAVDRQSGRSQYRELLATSFPGAMITVLEESPQVSAYALSQPASGARPARSMQVSFEVEAESRHMPVALASMISKYVRELLMARFQAYFAHHAPTVKPTAGYASDAKRFWQEIEPVLPTLAIAPEALRRMS